MTLTTTGPYRQSMRLADGRELIYYDRDPGLDRSAPDEQCASLAIPDLNERH
jgi:hypothetical protein